MEEYPGWVEEPLDGRGLPLEVEDCLRWWKIASGGEVPQVVKDCPVSGGVPYMVRSSLGGSGVPHQVEQPQIEE